VISCHTAELPDAATAHTGPPPTIALVGRPNVGKSTFLARASGRFVETANAPGTTVAIEGRMVAIDGRPVRLVDLPGTRSLDDRPTDDVPIWEHLLGLRPDAILVVVAAGDLARHLPLVLACRDLGLPIVVAVNLVDEAEQHGVALDTGRLAQLLNAPVHATCGRTGEGVAAALADALRLARQRIAVREGRRSPRGTVPAPAYPFAVEQQLRADAATLTTPMRSLGAAAAPDPLRGHVAVGTISARGAAAIRLAPTLEPIRWQVAQAWTAQVERRRTVPEGVATRLERLATAPLPGLPLFLGLTLGVFLAVVVIGGTLSEWMAQAWAAFVSPLLGSVVPQVIPDPTLAKATLWALDGGLLAMLSVGLPYVLLFYLILAAIEDSGYLTTSAVLADRIFAVLGLPGRAAIPLLVATGCNVPAIYGTRVLRTRRERALAALLVTLTPCAARSAVVIAALAPFAGMHVALAAFFVVAGLTIATGIAANAIIPGRQSSLVLELAPLRMPIAHHVAAKAWWRFRGFLVTATPIMLASSFALGLVFETGLWAPVAEGIGPFVEAWLGIPAIAGVAIAFAVLRKELALQLLLALAIVQHGIAGGSLAALMSPAQLFVYAVVTSVSVPCVATILVLSAELGRRTAAAISLTSIALALLAGGLLARLLGIA
jgi:ferrous iron transport protein B